MLVVPIQPVPNQTLQSQLANQPVSVHLYQTFYGLMADVYLGVDLVAAGKICENRNRIVRAAYAGLVGDLAFFDTQGDEDPVYTDLGTRFVLLYLDAADVAAIPEP